MNEDQQSYKKLAIAVIQQAVTEFVGRLRTPGKKAQMATRVMSIRDRIRAGEFLMERTDAIVHHWFTLADIPLARVRSKVEWQRRLSKYRADEKKLQREVAKIAARQRRAAAQAPAPVIAP
jgi:hypothetical protein